MTAIGIAIRSKLFQISHREAEFTKRGFEATDEQRRARLERVGGAFITGYNARLAERLDGALAELEPELHGFVVEGAAMAAALLDHLTPWRSRRVAQLLEEHPEHRYMIHVGTGWATARLRRSLRRAVAHRDPVLGWLVADGWGFHQCYFDPQRWASGRAGLPASAGYLARAVDQGIGRALWFVMGADPARAADRISEFPRARRPDLWAGLGLAAAYAGGAPRADLVRLMMLAGRHIGALAQGAAFAAAARAVAGNPAAHTDEAAQAITERSAGELARIALAHEPEPAVAAQAPSSAGAPADAYEGWRARVRETLALREVA